MIKRLLMITSDSIAVYHLHKKQIEYEYTCPNKPEGMELLENDLKLHPNIPTILLIDLVEEEFKVELVPHVLTGREALFSRTAQKLFRLAPWHYWKVLGRETKGRRDARVLFTAITNGDPLKNGLRVLHHYRTPITGIRSVPHLSEGWIKQAKIDGQLVLLVTNQKESGMRQTFFRDGKLVISRLSPSRHADNPTSYAEVVSEETTKTVRYLQRLQLLPFDAKVTLLLVSSREYLEKTLQAGEFGEIIQLQPYPLDDFANDLRLSSIPEGYHVDPILAHSAFHSKGNEYATLKERSYEIHRRIKQTIYGFSLLAAITTVIMVALIAYDIYASYTVTQGYQHEITQINSQYDENIKDALPSEVDSHFMRNAVLTADWMKNTPNDMAATLVTVGSVLAKYPMFVIESVQWEFDYAKEEPTQPTNARRRQPRNNATTKQQGEVLEIQGVIPNNTLAVRQIVESFQQLTNELVRATPNAEPIEVMQMPIDLNPGSSITRGSEPQQQTRTFAFRLKRRIDHQAGEGK